MMDFDRAVVEYSRAIEIDPKQTDFYSDRGIAYAANRDYGRAIADYDTALKIDPNNSQAYDGAVPMSARGTITVPSPTSPTPSSSIPRTQPPTNIAVMRDSTEANSRERPSTCRIRSSSRTTPIRCSSSSLHARGPVRPRLPSLRLTPDG